MRGWCTAGPLLVLGLGWAGAAAGAAARPAPLARAATPATSATAATPAAPAANIAPPAAPATAAPEATGEARRRAEALFNRYIDLEHAFDPALVDLYADGAHIESRIIVSGRPPTVRTWTGSTYKDLLRRALKIAKETKKDLNYYSSITYQNEGNRVRIRAMRYAELQKALSPVQLLVGPDATGTWRIFEELGESHPLAGAAPPPKH
jgi:hypothetical protein